MKKNELVWRELVDAAIVGQHRRWESVEDLAFRAGVAPATGAYALRRLVEIGAIQQHAAGFTLVNPQKVLTLFCAARSIIKNAVAVVTVSPSKLEGLIDSAEGTSFVAGGCEAAIELLGGVNTVSDYSEHLYYLRNEQGLAELNNKLQRLEVTHHTGFGLDRGNVTFLLADPRASRNWGKHTSFAQTYADLFATPGWQASEFRLALNAHYLSKRDWDQES